MIQSQMWGNNLKMDKLFFFKRLIHDDICWSDEATCACDYKFHPNVDKLSWIFVRTNSIIFNHKNDTIIDFLCFCFSIWPFSLKNGAEMDPLHL